jgi:hypothetical protein
MSVAQIRQMHPNYLMRNNFESWLGICLAGVSECKPDDLVPVVSVDRIGEKMKSAVKFLAAVGAVFAGTSGLVLANPAFNQVPEPGSLALVGVAVAALVLVARKGKK